MQRSTEKQADLNMLQVLNSLILHSVISLSYHSSIDNMQYVFTYMDNKKLKLKQKTDEKTF